MSDRHVKTRAFVGPSSLPRRSLPAGGTRLCSGHHLLSLQTAELL